MIFRIDKILLYTLLLILLLPRQATSQQTPGFTQYMLNKYQFNPAYAGFERSLSLNLSYRSQYSGIEASPEQYAINAHTPFYLWNGAIGISALSERLGVERNTSFNTSYNYIYESSLGYLSAGMSLGITSKRIVGNLIVTPEGEYDTGVNHNDPLLPINRASSLALNWKLGLYFINDYVEGGISIEDIATSNYSIGSINYEASKHLNIFAQSYFWLTDLIELQPSFLVRSNFKELQLDFSAIAYFSDIYGGFNFRGYSSNSIESFGIIIGTRLGRNYKVSYSFDSALNGLKNASEGSHEVLLQYNLNKLIGFGLPPKIIHNPRKL